MIDALNEGNQATLWKERLPGLIKSLEVYPAIGLVVSVRDTYFEDVIPERPETSCSATIIEHKGFKGLEYEAVRQFCIAYELNLPNVPILTPEFCNPLFLKIVCDTLEISGEKIFLKDSMAYQHYLISTLKILTKNSLKKDRNINTGMLRALQSDY